MFPFGASVRDFSRPQGQTTSAKDYDRVKKLTGVFIAAETALSLLFYISSELFPDKVLSMFITTPDVAASGVANFRIMFSFKLVGRKFYWLDTAANVIRPLYQLITLAEM